MWECITCRAECKPTLNTETGGPPSHATLTLADQRSHPRVDQLLTTAVRPHITHNTGQAPTSTVAYQARRHTRQYKYYTQSSSTPHVRRTSRCRAHTHQAVHNIAISAYTSFSASAERGISRPLHASLRTRARKGMWLSGSRASRAACVCGRGGLDTYAHAWRSRGSCRSPRF